MPYYIGVSRQRGRGFGALATSVVRTTIPIIRKYLVPVAKKIGRDIVETALPELHDVFSGKKSVKSALKTTATMKKQLGRGRKRKRPTKKHSTGLKGTKQSRSSHKRKNISKRSRANIFKNLQP